MFITSATTRVVSRRIATSSIRNRAFQSTSRVNVLQSNNERLVRSSFPLVVAAGLAFGAANLSKVRVLDEFSLQTDRSILSLKNTNCYKQALPQEEFIFNFY